jgi:hypothetical protein
VHWLFRIEEHLLEGAGDEKFAARLVRLRP